MPKALPASLDWYRTGANWIVSLSTAAIGAGVAFRSDVKAAQTPVLIVLVIAGLGFTAAVLSGVMLYFWLTTFANRVERIEELTEGVAATTDPNARAVMQDQLARATTIRDRARTRVGRFYELLLWSFFIAVFVGLPGVLFAELPAQPSPRAAKWSIVTVPCCPARCRIPMPHVLLTSAENGETWYLDSTATAAAVWRRVAFDSASLSNSRRE